MTLRLGKATRMWVVVKDGVIANWFGGGPMLVESRRHARQLTRPVSVERVTVLVERVQKRGKRK